MRGTAADTSVFAEARQRLAEIFVLFEQAAPDLRGGDLYRFGRQITGGLQEYIEAVTFLHYLETGVVLSHEALNASLCKNGEPVRRASRKKRGGRGGRKGWARGRKKRGGRGGRKGGCGGKTGKGRLRPRPRREGLFWTESYSLHGRRGWMRT